MESKLYTEISSFYLNLEDIKMQASKIKDKLKKFSREWAQVATFIERCGGTQVALANLCRRELKNEKKRDNNLIGQETKL